MSSRASLRAIHGSAFAGILVRTTLAEYLLNRRSGLWRAGARRASIRWRDAQIRWAS